LEWNLNLNNDALNAIKARTANLDALARGDQWRLASGARMGRGAPVDLRSVLQSGPAHTTIPLSAGERKAISQCDVVLILDHSGSMTARDCPSEFGGAEARISWCAEEMEKFADDLSSSFPHGFYFITFDVKPDVYTIQSSSQFRTVLQSLRAGGGTNLPNALNEAFRLHAAHPQQPMLVAVITDAEIDVHSAEQTIVAATHQFPLPNGVFITLLQVGAIAEQNAGDRLTYLEGLKARSGAAYDSFYGIPFSKVRQDGLGRDMLAGLRANAYAFIEKTLYPKKDGGSLKKQAKEPELTKSPAKSPDVPIMWPVK
jgi:hypothetical protein